MTVATVVATAGCSAPSGGDSASASTPTLPPRVGDVRGEQLDLPSGAVSEPVLELDGGEHGPLDFTISAEGTTAIDLDADVLFETASAELHDAASDALAGLLQAIRAQAPNASITVVGHTDSRGSEQDNLALSRSRARAVEAWFVDAGFPRARLHAEGRGETEPVVVDTDADGTFDAEAGRRNRRVVVLVDARPGRAGQ